MGGISMSGSPPPAPDQPPDGPAEQLLDWRRVVDWPAKTVMLRRDIADISAVLEQMEGAADDAACQLFVDLLRAALLARRRELAVSILTLHEIEIPSQEEYVTPQQKLSDQLSHVKDMVAQRRADIQPEKQPFTDRYAEGRPGLRQFTEQGRRAGLGLHTPLPDMRPSPGED